jgi:hypothetical protein
MNIRNGLMCTQITSSEPFVYAYVNPFYLNIQILPEVRFWYPCDAKHFDHYTHYYCSVPFFLVVQVFWYPRDHYHELSA